jgi:4-amino-4-deoxy-L-arabinose transferase-like glycosyltransferase
VIARVLRVLLGVALVGYLFDLGGSSIWDANEAFYAETPREMLESGDYVNPSFNYEPRFNKPVLSYWIVAGLYHLFGVSVAVQRLAITAGALVMVVAAYLLARAASPQALAPLVAALGLAANPRFFMFARRIMVDVSLAALMTLVLLCFALSERYPHRRRGLLLAMYVFVGLGVLTKGPVAAVLPALVFVAYLAFYGELGRIRAMMIPAGLAIVLAVVAPWYVALYRESGWTHITEFFIGENLDRFTSLVGPQSRGPLFYLPVLITDSLPWSLALPAAAVGWIGERRTRWAGPESRVRTLLLLWITVIVGFFSLSQTKQDLYIFPIVAAVAALGGDIVARGMAAAGNLERRMTGTTLAAGGVVLVCLGLAAIYLFGRSGIVYALDGARIAGMVAVAGGGATVWLARRQPPAAVAALLAALVAVNWTLVLGVLPSFERYKPVVPLSEAVLAHARAGDIVVHYDVALPSMVFYLQRHIDMTYAPEVFLERMRSGSSVLAVLADDRYEALRDELPPTCVVARQETFDAKLKELIFPRTPPAILLISTRCPP